MRGAIFIAGRLFLHTRRGRYQSRPLFGAALGIALSLIPLVMVDHVADAMIDGIIARYRETSSYHFQMSSRGVLERDLWESRAENIALEKGVLSAWVERQGFGLARASGQREGLTLRALPENAFWQDPSFARYIQFDEGEWNLSGSGILLGREAARRLNVAKGDELLVLTVRNMPSGRSIPRVSRFSVRGVFTSGYQDLDRSWAFISSDMGWQILSEESSRTFIGGKLPDPRMAEQSLITLKKSLGNRWFVQSWFDLNRYLLGNLESTRTLLLFIMALIILVAVFNVMTSLIMLTLERRREIGILKCTGSSSADIAAAFVLAAALSAIFGTLFGLGGGLVVSVFINQVIAGIESVLAFFTGLFRNIPSSKLLNEGYYLQEIPIIIRWRATAIIGGATILLSIMAAWIPAFRASRNRPLDVLRKH